ncbi:MAG: hypothetical protein DSY91_01745 [Deltaproteobacteria bacterium]|nr:MAG: hypothetical protein DSY91_01745 [Deltaproteobacteria bacterium]
MEEKAEGTFKCPACGGEAELFIEETPEGPEKVGTLICKDCGAKEVVTLEDVKDERLEAVKIAVNAERDAFLFYRDAAEKSTNPRGKDMFQQLSAFEIEHYKKMIHLYLSLKNENKWIRYTGAGELKAQNRIEGSKGGYETKDDDIQALKTAIAKEGEAAEFYREMAEKTEDPMGKEMFLKLVEEEETHRRLLNDQYYALQNQGEWMWGD